MICVYIFIQYAPSSQAAPGGGRVESRGRAGRRRLLRVGRAAQGGRGRGSCFSFGFWGVVCVCLFLVLFLFFFA